MGALTLMGRLAHAQTDNSRWARMADSALRTYRLTGTAGSSALAAANAPWSTASGWRRTIDSGVKPTVVLVAPADRPAVSLECPMPVAFAPGQQLATSRATMDSAAANPPGSPVAIPTRRYPCVNPLRP